MKSRNYVSNELVHWTGRAQNDESAMQALTSICQEKILRLSYCPNYVSDQFKKESAMVCFTDIPLRFAKEHCAIFGRFGIGFNKKSMIEYGANPALYTTKQHFDRIKKLTELLSRMEDLEKDREWKEAFGDYSFKEDETVALQQVTGFLQEYSYRNEDDSEYVTYYQREWRLTFNSLPFAGSNKPHEPGMSCFYMRNKTSYPIFKFSSDDVAFIVVPDNFKTLGDKLAKGMNCELKIYEASVLE
ncbi:hypothetical protein KFE96_00660 [Kordiimonas sp. SCSIO 12603]|uniref:abortive infection system antitoxin AbiGi family protein n=1 Tax=Kordiimonas sp. SCSIO 12603 TaxID=2829596 RepID=UPI00210695D3|nr:abortive infection system antitoxin AbiGi family protein [Kordiimonas sp. SCSIO 12603]UTW58854.1 hypothetical protein KFE96_00660 [Kordiimonas sp. SCSIO 12603]